MIFCGNFIGWLYSTPQPKKEVKEIRCPECKATLIDGGEREHETLVEHVSDPNKERYPLRPTYVCPNKCFGEEQFFDYEGASYGGSLSTPRRYWSALDSIDREINIEIFLGGIRRGERWSHCARELSTLVIEGENDIPPKWKWRFYWLKGKLTRYRSKRIRSQTLISK